ncbi:MAG: hypothetical protein U0930_02065 [Pirellulales bacterium]
MLAVWLAVIAFETAVSLGVALLVLAVLIHLAWSRRAASKLQVQLSQVNDRLDQIESRLDPRPIIPPMSIFLEPIEHRWHLVDELCKRIDQWMQRQHFQRIGYFRVDQWEGEELCAYLSQDRTLVASIRMAKDAVEPFVEFLFDLGDGERGGTCNPPASVIRPSDDSAGQSFDGRLSQNFSLIDRMYHEACELASRHQVVLIDPDRIAQFYEQAHEFEMAQRVHCGGITETEIRDVLVRQGLEPTESQVATIQRHWQLAIEDYLLEFSARGKNRLVDGDRVLVVHAGSLGNFLIAQLESVLAKAVDNPREIAKLASELQQLVDQYEPREAIHRFLALLPTGHGIELVDQIVRPVPADLYVLPE